MFYIVAVICGLPLFAYPTIFWTSIFTAIYISKWGA
jgi:hypothetical protein